MDKKDDRSKATGVAAGSDVLLSSALRRVGLLFPTTDSEVLAFVSNPANMAELPESLKGPMEIIKRAEEEKAGGATKIVDLGEGPPRLHSVVGSSGQFASAGLFRAKDETNEQDEKEIADVLKDVAKKLKDDE